MFTVRRLVGGALLAALALRVAMLVTLGHADYVTGLSQGDLAYGILSGQGLVHNALPGCGIQRAQVAYRRLIDVEEYLQRHTAWCAELGQADVTSVPEPFISYAMPGAGMLLAALNMVTGRQRYLEIEILQIVLDCVGALLLFAVGRSYFGTATGVGAAFAYAAFPPLARLAVPGALRDAYMPVLLMASLYWFLRGVQGVHGRRWIRYGMAGVLLGVACYFRPTVLLLPAFWGLLLVLARRRRQAVLAIACVSVPMVLLLLPWWARNYWQFGRFIPTNAGMPETVWAFFGEQPNPLGAQFSDEAVYQQYREWGGTGTYYSLDFADDALRPRIAAAIRDHPVWFLSVLARRVLQVLTLPFDWGINPYSLPDPIRRLVFNLSTSVLFAASAAVIWHNRHRWQDMTLLASVAVYNTAAHLPIGITARYILPGMPVLLLFAVEAVRLAGDALPIRLPARSPSGLGARLSGS